MGQERSTRVSVRGRDGETASEGKLLLETSELIFRGGVRLRIPFREIDDVTAEGGALAITWRGGHATFELGADAEQWARKIRNPRGLLDKLGVRPGMRVAVLGVEDEGFRSRLRERTPEIALEPLPDADLVFYEADAIEDLAKLTELRSRIKDNGAIWVVSPKGKGARVKDVDVIAASRTAGLVDTKVVAFSDTHTALKLVVPVALRKKR